MVGKSPDFLTLLKWAEDQMDNTITNAGVQSLAALTSLQQGRVREPVLEGACGSSGKRGQVQDPQRDHRGDAHQAKGKGAQWAERPKGDAEQARDDILLKGQNGLGEKEELAKVGEAGSDVNVVAQDV